MAPTRVILMSCGSYNPPTNMHLRMFEIARDHLHRMGTHIVVGGVISPVHDAYAKKELADATHRCAMLELALQNNDWIRISSWESKQNGWTKTRLSLQYHQNVLNSVLFDTNDIKHHSEIEDLSWIPKNVRNSSDTSPIQIKLLCGADLLESFGTPGLWADEDIDAIVGQHGLVVITREGSNPNKFIYDSDILSKYMHNILIVTEWIPNEVSSTKIRRALKRGESVKYLVQDPVIDYIYQHGIYDAKATSTIKLDLSSNNANHYLNINSKYQTASLTPSPSDVTMESPSPVEIISIEVPDSVLKKNLQNSPSLTKIKLGNLDDADRMREKFISVISENGNKLLSSIKTAYPGQAKQIIATETGESQILDEVGLNDDIVKVVIIEENNGIISREENKDAKCRVDDSSSEGNNLLVDGDEAGDLRTQNADFSQNKTDVDSEKIEELGTDRRNDNFDETDSRLLSRSTTEEVEHFLIDNYSRCDSDRVSCDNTTDSNKNGSNAAIREVNCTNVSREGIINDRDEELNLKNLDLSSKNPNFYDEIDTCKIDGELQGSSDLNKENKNIKRVSPMSHESVSSKTEEPNENAVNTVEDLKVQTLSNKEPLKNVIGKTEIYHTDTSNEEQTKAAANTHSINKDNTIKAENKSTNDDKLQNFNNEETNSLGSDFLAEKQTVKRVANKEDLEIDGKYLKSLVNSRKSPKKLRNKWTEQEVDILADNRYNTDDALEDSNSSRDTEFSSCTQIINFTLEEEIIRHPKQNNVQDAEIEAVISEEQTNVFPDHFKKETRTATLGEHRKLKRSDILKRKDRPDPLLQGSLDSVNISESRTSGKSKTSFETGSKKSKSYESIKHDTTSSYRSFEVSYTDVFTKLKSDSTSQLVTADDFDGRTDDCCTECCYANDPSMTENSLNRETFYTLRSSGSSPADLDSMECETCSACNLQDSVDALNFSSLGLGEPTCELCEIYGDTDFVDAEDFVPVPAALPLPRGQTDRRKLPLSLPREILQVGLDEKTQFDSTNSDRFEIENCSLPNEKERQGSMPEEDKQGIRKGIISEDGDHFDSDNELFEIENCGLADGQSCRIVEVRRPRAERSTGDVSDRSGGKRESRARDRPCLNSFEETMRLLKCFLPRDEVGMMSKSAKRIDRKGSFVKRDTSDHVRDKRRYASVDNLQQSSKQILPKTSGEKRLGSKGTKLIASADNIQAVGSKSTKVGKLQKSADDVACLDSSVDNLNPLKEGSVKEDEEEGKGDGQSEQPKVRDNDMVKMILTKHGIKIISEKETAL